ncbi:hypothetical protein [Pelagicoccus sp. SDUM812002]|uniref:hypothetical protein n=1 Tax=Pelagicoccus sp. SDUM812002 TaxID=3041266 RepID=UPI00280F7BA8|nr:hypothetical protein [Pelagicoccus sp. SDUM812002]MDQ8186870.1 hypothetical protein [Pelagicoccus sp. SDUM812002]
MGSPHHERAMAAFARGEDPSVLATTIANEEALWQRAMQFQAELERQLEQQWIEAQAPVKEPTWWESYSSQYPNGRYDSQGSTGGSSTQQMRNYRRELNNKIYSTGRNYGKQYQL